MNATAVQNPLLKLLAASALADAENAHSQLLAELAILSIATNPMDANQAPWVRVEHGARSVSLYCSDAPTAHALSSDVVASIVRGVLVRASEHAELVATRERMHMLSTASFEGLFVHIDGLVIDANDQLAELLRCRREDLLGPDTMRRCVAAEDLPSAIQRMAEQFEGAYTITACRADGTRFRAELQAKQGKLGERPVRVVAVRDVTERERTMLLLRENELQMRDLAEAAFDFFVLSRGTTVLDVGGDPLRVIGYSSQHIISRSPLDFVAPEAIHLPRSVIAEQRSGTYESVLLSASGERVPVEVTGAASSFGGEPARIAGIRDLRQARRVEAERVKLQQQLERSQRLESLGVLAGGIAHDFNNLLLGVLGNAELLSADLTDASQIELLNAIREAGERAAALTRQMLAYAGRGSSARPEPIELGALLKQLQSLLAASLSKKAKLTLSVAANCVVRGDRATLTQVLMNLLTNASDALGEDQGRIEIKVNRVTDPDVRWDDALGAIVKPGAWVLIEVEDTGSGMDEATRARIFEPFFSTKQMGHGLGLATCLGIVRSHGGAVLVESTPGQGSHFSVLLPASEEREEPSSQPSVSPTAPCRVLIIDDEPLVRFQLRRLLELRGFEVEEADGGRSGIDAHASYKPEVIIVDFTMHDLNGIEVVRRIREVNSKVAIVLSSGNLEYNADGSLWPGEVQSLLHKPYGLDELMEAVEHARRAKATDLK